MIPPTTYGRPLRKKSATLLRKETSWAHILALQTVVLKYGSPEAANEAIKKGVADFITKPFRKDTIVFTMNRVLELARLRKKGEPGT